MLLPGLRHASRQFFPWGGWASGPRRRRGIDTEPFASAVDQDIDALRIVAEGVNKLKRPDNATIVVTHYQRLLNYIVPDHVHVLAGGRIIKSGGKELALELEAKGYDWLLEPVGA